MFSGISWQEFKEIPELFSNIRKKSNLLVTPGNHDPGIEEFLRPEEILPKEGSLLEDIGVLHGHTRPDPILAGQSHPCRTSPSCKHPSMMRLV